jgi:methionine synthase I (cobalamin-dependent)
VVTLTGSNWTGAAPEQDCLVDGVRRDEACARLLAAGANVVGINCACGPVVGRRCPPVFENNNYLD